MSFEAIWANIEKNAGETFSTKSGIQFTYHMDGSAVVPDHTGYPLAKSQFAKAAEIKDLRGPGQINFSVRGPSYIYAILTDPRIR